MPDMKFIPGVCIVDGVAMFYGVGQVPCIVKIGK